MEIDTIYINLEDYNKLISEREQHNIKIEKILNGDTVNILPDEYHHNLYGNFIVRTGCNFYSASDSNKELLDTIKHRNNKIIELEQEIEEIKIKKKIKTIDLWFFKITYKK